MTAAYGPRRSGSGRDEPPQPVGTVLERLVRALGAPELRAVAALDTVWASVAGPDVAAHTCHVSLRSGVLTVTLDDPSRASAVRWQGPTLAEGVAAALGSPVTDLAVRVQARPGG